MNNRRPTPNTEQVAKKLGMSVRCLQLWDESGLLPVARARPGRYQRRIWDQAAIRHARLLARLRAAGLSFQNLRKIRLNGQGQRYIVILMRHAAARRFRLVSWRYLDDKAEVIRLAAQMPGAVLVAEVEPPSGSTRAKQP